jgi:predicted nucleotidyltransferase
MPDDRFAHPSQAAHPIDPAVRAEVLRKLQAVETTHNVRVLYACESGSRGWGFASPDSDYDARFLFVRPARDYLRVTPLRDVIEEVPGPVFDVNGWDLRKALELLAKGNATLVEWLSSPVVYRQDEAFMQGLREAAAAVYQPVRSFHHYFSMARGNHREYLQGDVVRAKKYLYVLRPLLAAQWVLQREDAPPMPFEQLVDALVTDADVRRDIDELLVQKRQASEQEWLPARPRLNAFIRESLTRLHEAQPAIGKPNLAPLDRLLADTVLNQP